MRKLYQVETIKDRNLEVSVHQRNKAENFQIKDARPLKEVKAEAENLHLQTPWAISREKSVTAILKIRKKDKFMRYVINYITY